MAQPSRLQTFLGIVFIIVALIIGIYSRCDSCQKKDNPAEMQDKKRGCNW